jgi:hypothetical protein
MPSVVRVEEEAMARRLLTVEHVFTIEGRGIGLAPVAVPEGNERFRVHDPIDIRLPDGRIVRTEVASWMLPTPNPECGLNILLPPSFKKDDVPAGSEVWSVDAY